MAGGVEGAMRGDAPGDDAGATVAETSGDSATTPASAVTAASGPATTGVSIATPGGEGAGEVTSGDAISSTVRRGSSLDRTIHGALEGRLAIHVLPRLDLVRYFDGNVYSLSNSRLFVFRVLQIPGKVDRLRGMFYPMTSDRVQRKIHQKSRSHSFCARG